MGTYAISDIHGNLAIAQQIVRRAIEGNTVYFLGDACDRGEHGWKIIKMFLTTENIVYLRGNHEDMLMRAMHPYFMDTEDYRYTRAYEIWSWNGASTTEMGILLDDVDKARLYFGQLYTLHLTADYTNQSGQIIHMCHSGWEYFNDAIDAHAILWDREHYFRNNWLGEENEFMIHGHTPIPYLLKEITTENDGWLWENEDCAWHYCDGHKIDIDMMTIATHKACLLDLDTFEEIILEGEE